MRTGNNLRQSSEPGTVVRAGIRSRAIAKLASCPEFWRSDDLGPTELAGYSGFVQHSFG